MFTQPMEIAMTKKDIHVVPHPEGWATKTEGASRAGVVVDTQREGSSRQGCQSGEGASPLTVNCPVLDG